MFLFLLLLLLLLLLLRADLQMKALTVVLLLASSCTPRATFCCLELSIATKTCSSNHE